MLYWSGKYDSLENYLAKDSICAIIEYSNQFRSDTRGHSVTAIYSGKLKNAIKGYWIFYSAIKSNRMAWPSPLDDILTVLVIFYWNMPKDHWRE